MDSEMGWLRRIGIAVAALMVAAVAGLACGGGDGGTGVDLSDVDAVVAGALEALSPPGQVVHLRGSIEEEGEARSIEIWIDAGNERGRWETVYAGGSRAVSVTNGWEVTTYDPSSNALDTWSMLDYPISEGYTGNPVFLSVWYVWMMSTADELAVVGRENIGGHDAIVVDMARTRPEDSGDQAAGTDELTLALDARSLLPVHEEWRFVSTAGEESVVSTVSYDQAEYLSPDDLPADLFSPQSLEELATPEPAE
jgi:outer membrane lipoprotein-sorting protein